MKSCNTYRPKYWDERTNGGPEMKLYVWTEVEALKQCGDGIAFALAPNKEVAIKAILKKYWEEEIESIGRKEPDFILEEAMRTYTYLNKELKTKEPLMVESIEGFYEYGTA